MEAIVSGQSTRPVAAPVKGRRLEHEPAITRHRSDPLDLIALETPKKLQSAGQPLVHVSLDINSNPLAWS